MKIKLHLIATMIAVAFPVFAGAQEKGRDPAGRRPGMQQPAGGPDFPRGPMQMMQLMPLMKVLDSDGDGTLSATEIANASKALVQLDKDGDGVIKAEEMRPDPTSVPGGFAGGGGGANGPMQGAMMGKLFEKSDANGDGKLSGDEIPERMRDRLKVIDKDGDGAITKSEFAAVAARMEEGAGKRPGRDENTGGGVKPKRPI